MKVTMVGTLPPMSAGQSPYCARLAEELAHRLEVQFIAFRSIYPRFLYPVGKTNEDDTTLRAPEHPRLTIHRLLAWYDPLSWIRGGLLATGDITHIQWWTSVLFPVILAMMTVVKCRGKTVVLTIHNVLGHETGLWDRLATAIVLRMADHLIVHSEENKRQLQQSFGIDGEKVSVIPIGVYDVYQDEELSQEEARHRLDFSSSERVILIFGHIRKYKGVDVLLRAFAQARQQVPNARLLIAGKNWVPWEPYQEIIDGLGLGGAIVAHLDYISSSKVKEYFTAADVVVLPYLEFAAQSGPGNIALAFGKPLVVTDVGGLPELVKDVRQVVPPGDVEALAQALIELLGDESRLEQAGHDSRALAEEYSWSHVAEKTIEVYRQLGGGSG